MSSSLSEMSPFFCNLEESDLSELPTSSKFLSSLLLVIFLGGSFSSSSSLLTSSPFFLELFPVPFPLSFTGLVSSSKSSSSFILGGGAFGSRVKKDVSGFCQYGVG